MNNDQELKKLVKKNNYRAVKTRIRKDKDCIDARAGREEQAAYNGCMKQVYDTRKK